MIDFDNSFARLPAQMFTSHRPTPVEAPYLLAGNRDLAARLGPSGRLAIGDPEHVPAGIYARDALERAGSWDAVAALTVYADNERAALVLVERGAATLGIVYATDARISSFSSSRLNGMICSST